ncbi:MAG: LLM class flavin-dependent oxidoreductase [Pseudomonadota bacterium]
MSLLASGNDLKLAIFGANVSHGCAISSVDGNIQVSWDETLRIAQTADAAGIEAMIPVARWKGFGGETNFNHRSFETYTWAAGLAQATGQINILATSHVPTIHPVLAAKQAATIDHISNGRFALNIVAGWNASEIAMFGTPQREHDERYAVAEEWLTLIRQLWTQEGFFDFEGRFFKCPHAYAEPKPVQKPHPPIMSAGVSDAGRRFAAQHADLNFLLAPTLEIGEAILNDVKTLARKDFQREVQVWGMTSIVMGDTQADAEAYYHHYVHEKGDWEAASNMMSVFAPNSGSYSVEHEKEHLEVLVSGYSAFPIVGSVEQVADQLIAMSNMGFDGLTLCWANYDEGLARFNAEVMPLLEQAGVRRPL